MPLRKFYIDSEADNADGNPVIEQANKPVTCIGIYDNFRKCMVTFAWRSDLTTHKEDRRYKGFVRPDTECDWHIYYFSNEYDMLDAFIDFSIACDEDLWTAWNLYGFDAQYIVERMNVLGFLRSRIKQMSPQGEVYIHRQDKNGRVKRWHLTEDIVKIRGRILFDLLPAYRKLHVSELRSFNLPDVIEDAFKVQLESEKGSWWHEDLEKLISVNATHVEATVALDEVFMVIDLYVAISQVSGIDFTKVLSNSLILDQYFLMNKPDKLVLLPSKYGEDTEDSGERPGAIVLPPEPGVVENVLHFDLKKLYPSLVISFNMSPETLIDIQIGANSIYENVINVLTHEITIVWDRLIVWLQENAVSLPDYVVRSEDGIAYAVDEKKLKDSQVYGNYQQLIDEKKKLQRLYENWKIERKREIQAQHKDWINATTGVSFRRDVVGFVPQLYEGLYKLRQSIEDEMEKYDPKSQDFKIFKIRRQVVKDLINSVFGYLWFRSSRLYTPDIGRTITTMGQEIFKWTQKKMLVIFKLLSIYGDTDSIVIKLGDGEYDLAMVKVTGEAIARVISETYNEFADQFNIDRKKHVFQLDFEKFHRRMLFTGAKKNYATLTVLREGKVCDFIDSTGLAVVRSDTAKLAVQTQSWLIEKVLRNPQTPELIEEVIEYIRDSIYSIRHGFYSPMDLGVPKRLSKSLDDYEIKMAWVKGAEYANKYLGANFGRGSKPVLVYVKRTFGRFPATDCVCIDSTVDLPKEIEVDWNKMIDTDLKAKLTDILEAVHIPWDFVAWDPEQSKLEEFLKLT